MTLQPLVSIILTYLNPERFVREAIDWLSTQTHPNWELILVGNGPRDDKTCLAKRYTGKHAFKVRYVEHPVHQQRGLSATRNLGIHHARGEYVAFLEPGEVWLPNKLERQVAIFSAQPKTRMVVGLPDIASLQTDERGSDRRILSYPLDLQHDTLYEPPTLAALFCSVPATISPRFSSLLIRRETIQQLHGYDESFRDLYEPYADQAFLAKALLTQPIFIAGETWIVTRIDRGDGPSIRTNPKSAKLARLFYLNWLGTILLEQQTMDVDVWSALQEAISEFGVQGYHRHPLQSCDDRPITWRLRVGEQNAASLIFPPERSDLVRIDIKEANSGPRYDIQLNLPRLRVMADHQYRVTFRVRADRSRTMCVGLAKTEAPWSGLGFYKTVDLTADWKTYEHEFVAQSTEDNARILFDVGAEAPSVEISSVALESLPAGTPIKPNLSKLRPIDAYQMEQFFIRQAADLRGRVLEIGDGGLIGKYGNKRVDETLVCQITPGECKDLKAGRHVDMSDFPNEHFDFVIVPHVLHSLQDVRKAVRSFHRVLKTGGVLLATIPGVTPSCDSSWGQYWAWTFTPMSIKRLFEEAFLKGNVTIKAYGNVPSVISLVHALPNEVLQQDELDRYEAGYEVLITVRAVKSIGSGFPSQ